MSFCLIVPGHCLNQYWLGVIGFHTNAISQKMRKVRWQELCFEIQFYASTREVCVNTHTYIAHFKIWILQCQWSNQTEYGQKYHNTRNWDLTTTKIKKTQQNCVHILWCICVYTRWYLSKTILGHRYKTCSAVHCLSSKQWSRVDSEGLLKQIKFLWTCGNIQQHVHRIYACPISQTIFQSKFRCDGNSLLSYPDCN